MAAGAVLRTFPEKPSAFPEVITRLEIIYVFPSLSQCCTEMAGCLYSWTFSQVISFYNYEVIHGRHSLQMTNGGVDARRQSLAHGVMQISTLRQETLIYLGLNLRSLFSYTEDEQAGHRRGTET